MTSYLDPNTEIFCTPQQIRITPLASAPPVEYLRLALVCRSWLGMQRDDRLRNRAELGIRTEHIFITYLPRSLYIFQ